MNIFILERIVKYKAPRAAAFGPGGANVEDISYDGRIDIDDSSMIDGIGQLVDGIIGDDPHSSSNLAHWVGWSNLNPINIIFEFNDIRLFENCTIYAANSPVRGIEVFRNIQIWFSNDGELYENPLNMSVEEKSVYSPGIIPVSISLKSRNSKFIKIELIPRSKWLLLSEIIFTSCKFVTIFYTHIYLMQIIIIKTQFNFFYFLL